MRTNNKKLLGTLSPLVLILATAAGLGLASLARGADRLNAKPANVSLAEEVRHQLVLLPWYGVFDNLQYEIKNGHEVVLSGQVVQPVLKSDAEAVVKRIDGVEKVEDDIEVLPVSTFDDRIRLATYRAIYHNAQLDRYALQAVPPIHIIVRNGQVTLVGVVAVEADKDIAGLMADKVPGVFSVTNNLAVERNSGKPPGKPQ